MVENGGFIEKKQVPVACGLKLATGSLARFSCQTCCVRSDRLSALVHLRSSVLYRRFACVVFRSYNDSSILYRSERTYA